MTCLKALTASERYALAVLSAWSRRKFAALESAVVQLPVRLPETLPAGERERMDLTRDLGRKLLVWHRTGQIKNRMNEAATLGLLRHLARCDQAGSKVA
jgi:hypothetical protein